jgi:hypothetical protein
MMRNGSPVLVLSALALAIAGGCGGSKPPQSAAPAAASSASSAPSAASSSAKPAPSAAAESTDASKPSRKPRDILTDADVTFVLAFDQSEPGKAADEKCTKSAKQDAKKRTECMSRAHDRIQVEAMRFRQDDDHIWWWVTMRRRGNTFDVITKVQIDFADETDRSIVIKPKAKGSMAKDAQIDIPNNYSISLKDPQHGTLVYEAKIGPAGK